MLPELDPVKPDPDPDAAGSRSGKTGSSSGFCRILIWMLDIKTKISALLQFKPTSDGNYKEKYLSWGKGGKKVLVPKKKFLKCSDMDPATSGAGSGLAG